MEKNSKRRGGRMSTTKDSDLDGKDSSNEAKTTSDDTNKKQDQPHSAVTTDDDSSIVLIAATTTATPTKLERSLSVKTRSNKTLSNNATCQQTSTIVTRKRQMSTDLKNSHANKSSLIKNDSQLNLESFLNEDNSNSSSVSGCPLNASFSGYLSQSFGSSYKKLKQLHGNNYEASSLSGMGGVKTENASALTNTATNDGEVESIMNCPIQGCTSIGHLDGLTERHFSFDACPIYFGMTSEECIERRKAIETKLVDLEKKLSHANNEKKAPAHKVNFFYDYK
jgi:histone acetyltransferase MYST2